MNKNENVEKDPEILSLEGLLSDMEADSAHDDYTVPEDWDRDFRKAIRQGLRKQRNKMQKSKMKRKLRLTGIAAIMMILLSVDGLVVQEVQAKGIVKIFQFIFDLENDWHVTYGTDESMLMNFVDEDSSDIFFDGKSLDEVFTQVKAELKMPIFYFDDVFGEYEMKEAKYNKDFHVLNIEIETSDGIIYITQKNSPDELGSGTVFDTEQCSIVDNNELEQKIQIYKTKSNDGYMFSVKENSSLLSVAGNMSLKECENAAKSLRYE